MKADSRTTIPLETTSPGGTSSYAPLIPDAAATVRHCDLPLHKFTDLSRRIDSWNLETSTNPIVRYVSVWLDGILSPHNSGIIQVNCRVIDELSLLRKIRIN